MRSNEYVFYRERERERSREYFYIFIYIIELIFYINLCYRGKKREERAINGRKKGKGENNGGRFDSILQFYIFLLLLFHF